MGVILFNYDASINEISATNELYAIGQSQLTAGKAVPAPRRGLNFLDGAAGRIS